MEQLTPQQRLQIVQIYFSNGKSLKQTHKALCEIYSENDCPTEHTIERIVEKLRTTFTLLDPKPVQRQKTARSDDNITAVRESLAEDPNLSIRQRSQQLGISPSTIRKILREDLGITAVQERSFIPDTPKTANN